MSVAAEQLTNGQTYFPNVAGQPDIDSDLVAELTAAGIKAEVLPITFKGEVKTRVMGTLQGWSFKRAWRYWIAEGPGIPPVYANALHATHGQYVRVDGHCEAPSPLEWFKGFAVGTYHVDTQEGLKALADTLNRVVAEAGQPA